MTPNTEAQPEGDPLDMSSMPSEGSTLPEPSLQWQRDCLHDLEHSDLSYAELAVKYDRARDTITKLKERYSITRPTTVRKGSIPLSQRQSISTNHRAIGVRLTLFRDDRLITDLADQMNVSRTVYKAMEVGAHDFTLTQILRISEVLGVPAEDLWVPMTLKATQG